LTLDCQPSIYIPVQEQTEEQSGISSLAKTSLRLRAVLSLIGFTAVIAQIVLMRELIVVFYGNEISLGLMLANWLLWTALGSSLLGRLVSRARQPQKLMAALQVLVSLALPLTIVAMRASRLAFHSLPGEILGPRPMFLTSLVTLSFFCVISGSMFAAGSRLFADEVGTSTAIATSSVYLFEAVGSGVGGILASLLLIRFLTAFQIASLLGLLNLLAAVSLAARESRRRYALLGALLAAVAFLLFPFGNRALECKSLAYLWHGFRVIETRNSVYGNLAVVEAGQARSLFENGLPVASGADVAAAEEAVHFALLEHPSPRTLLLVGGGVNGSLAQALQHSTLQQVDYVELDPTILDLARRRFPKEWAPAEADRRVAVHQADGRLFLKTCARSFDVIIVNLPDPQTAQLNRFYTLEFFREAALKLTPGGILSFQVTAAENYISPELADFLRCMSKTLRAVFPEVAAIPGGTVHFFASNQPGTLTSDPAQLIARLQSRRLQTRYVREYYLPFRLAPDRMMDLRLQTEPQPETPLNRDFAPIAYYFDVALWSARFHGASSQWFAALARIRFGEVLAAVALALVSLVGLVCWLCGRGGLQTRPYAAGFCVTAMGATLIGLEVLLLLGFQAIYGYVYHQLAIVIAALMVGMAVGARLASPSARQPATAPASARSEIRLLAVLQLLAAASPLVLYGLLECFSRARHPLSLFLVSQVLFPTLALLAGMLGGYQFPLASRIYFACSKDSARSAGTLYGLDLLGACLAAVALSAYLVPVFGFLRTAVLMAVVDLAPAALAGLCVSDPEAHPG
jgi:spermidine synthase